MIKGNLLQRYLSKRPHAEALRGKRRKKGRINHGGHGVTQREEN